VTGPRASATLVSPLPVRFIIQSHPPRSSIPQAAINTTTMLSNLRRSSLHLAKSKALVRAAGSSAPRRTLVQPSGADRASVVDVPSTYQDDNLLSPRPGGSIRVRDPRVLLTESIFFRHAWLQVRGTSPRRNFERQGPTDLSGYAGLTQFDQIAPLLTRSSSGNNTCRPPSARRDAPVLDGPIRKPTQPDSRLRLGG